MSNFDEEAAIFDDFSGKVRVFPLPNLVMFPHAVQPLHVFEPRYCELLQDALSDDRLIAMALLKPGWESDYEGRPPLESVVCVGRLVSHARDGDRYNLLLMGVRRARLVREEPPTRSYRTAQVELLPDLYPDAGASQRADLRRRLLDALSQRAANSHVQKQIEQLTAQQVPLGLLTDVASFTMNLDVAVKQSLLGQCNVDRRAEMLLEALDRALDRSASQSADDVDFPPGFSVN